MRRYFRIWKKLSTITISSFLSNRIDAFTFFFGKVIRFLFFLALIFALFRDTQTFLGYDKAEFVLIFLTFNLVDLIAQIFLRGVYYFADDVRKGNFDFSLVKPVSPLFLALSRYDILDTIFIIPIVGFVIYLIAQLDVTFFGVILYLVFLAFGVAISASFHILSAAFTIHSPDNNGFIWLYREVLGIARFPDQAFSSALRIFFTFVVPVFVIATYPVKALLSGLRLELGLVSIGYTVLFLAISLGVWRWSLKKYSSASS